MTYQKKNPKIKSFRNQAWAGTVLVVSDARTKYVLHSVVSVPINFDVVLDDVDYVWTSQFHHSGSVSSNR